jgi:hypothetical protein
MISEGTPGGGELARYEVFTHMRRGSRADEAVANLVRSGRKQPQRFRLGSFGSHLQALALRPSGP